MAFTQPGVAWGDVSLLVRPDRFVGDPKLRIPLPGDLDDAATLLEHTGQGECIDDLVTAMKRAAAIAVPEARTLLVDIVKNISVDDALQIVRGSDTAVTDFFARKTHAPLGLQFLPIVTSANERVALADKRDAMAAMASGAAS